MTAMFFMGQASGDPWAAIDGRLNAPAGAAPYSSLLLGYVKRPPWHVAGVEYAVGAMPGTLKVPGVDTLPAGCSFSTGVLHVGGGAIFDGWHFQNINIQHDIAGSCTFQNCFFDDIGGDSPSGREAGINVASSSQTDLTLTNCYITSNGFASVNGATSSTPCNNIIWFQGTGVLTVQYCWFKDIEGIPWTILSNCSLNIKYNVFDGMASWWPNSSAQWSTQNHGNLLANGGNGMVCNVVWDFNTIWGQVNVNEMEGCQFYSNGSSIALTGANSCSYNTVVCDGLNRNAATRQNSHAYSRGDVYTIPSLPNTFFFVVVAGTSASSTPAGISGWTEANYSSLTPIADGTCFVFANDAQMSAFIHGGATNNGTLGSGATAQAINNYMDRTNGASGAGIGQVKLAYTNGGTNSLTNWTVSGNTNMVNGKTILVDNSEI